jgi:tetratricopeptide (TPR) repeat protein
VKAIESDGDDGHQALGDYYRDLGNKELAIRNYKTSLELNPKNADAEAALETLEGR